MDAVTRIRHRVALRTRIRRLRDAPDTTLGRLDRWHATRLAERFTLDLSRYRGTFLSAPPPPQTGAAVPQAVPRHVFCLWTGDNPFSPARRRHLDRLRDRFGPDRLVLVTPRNLSEFLVDGAPLPSAYRHLSLVHRSDYLRSYLLHHHGGGYTDLKAPTGDWEPALAALTERPDLWAVGYPEVGHWGVAPVPGTLGKDLRRHWRLLIGMGSFVMRPRSPLTAHWLHEVDSRVSAAAGALARHPGDERGRTPGYPLAWTSLLGDVLQPLVLRHHEHVAQDDRLLPDLHDYR